MKPKDKKLLLQDLCTRLPYRVKVEIKSYENENKPWFGELSCKDLECFMRDVGYVSVKPYLRPMSSMTEKEHRTYISLLAHSLPHVTLDWLNKKHFDYRSNEDGECLIERGLALEAPEGMYNKEDKQ